MRACARAAMHLHVCPYFSARFATRWEQQIHTARACTHARSHSRPPTHMHPPAHTNAPTRTHHTRTHTHPHAHPPTTHTHTHTHTPTYTRTHRHFGAHTQTNARTHRTQQRVDAELSCPKWGVSLAVEAVGLERFKKNTEKVWVNVMCVWCWCWCW